MIDLKNYDPHYPHKLINALKAENERYRALLVSWLEFRVGIQPKGEYGPLVDATAAALGEK